MTTSRDFDGFDRLTAVTNSPATAAVASFNYAYNSANQRSAVTNADGSRWAFLYDSLGQVTSGKRYWPDASAVAGQQFEYGFDTIGNRRTDKTGGDGSGANLRQATYTVDLLNQVTAKSGPGYASIVGEADSDATVKVNALTAERKGTYFAREIPVASLYQGVTNVVLKNSTNGQSETFSKEIGHLFPPEGPAMTNQEGNLAYDTRWHYKWDAENRLARMYVGGTATSAGAPELDLRLAYDWQWRRLSKVVSNKVADVWQLQAHRKFVYDGWNLVAETDQNNVLLKSHVWGLDLSGTLQGAGGIGGLLATILHTGTNAGVYFPAFDGNGNVMAYLSASNGVVVAEYEYGPFGELLRASGPMAKEFNYLFSTKYYDWETGLSYYGHRYLRDGRWLSRDPINEPGSKLLRGERPKYRVDGELIDDMRLDEEMNLYHFVFNNPINRIDYLGLGHNFGRCCNKSGRNEWALLDGVWRMLKPGECTGILEDCDGMTCGGGFYYVSALEWASCVTPGCDSPPFNSRRWTPGGSDPGARPPGGPGGRGSTQGNTPPGYNYGSRPPCACKNPRSGADHSH